MWTFAILTTQLESECRSLIMYQQPYATIAGIVKENNNPIVNLQLLCHMFSVIIYQVLTALYNYDLS
jgi:hypothetical protein